MKKSLPVIPNKKNILASQAEQMVLDKLPVDQKTLRLAAKLIEPKNLKRIAIAAAGGSILISIISTYSRNQVYRAMVAKEMKKQLDPLRKKLDTLEAQNTTLLKQNAELKAQLKKTKQLNRSSLSTDFKTELNPNTESNSKSESNPEERGV